MDEVDKPESAEAEALRTMIRAWRSRNWLEQHAGELTSEDPCNSCLGVTRAVLRGRQGSLRDLMCTEARNARDSIEEAFTAVKQITGHTLT